jgi:hypothetical protein
MITNLIRNSAPDISSLQSNQLVSGNEILTLWTTTGKREIGTVSSNAVCKSRAGFRKSKRDEQEERERES